MKDDKKNPVNAFDAASKLIANDNLPKGLLDNSSTFAIINKIASNPIFNNNPFEKYSSLNSTYDVVVKAANPYKGIIGSSVDLVKYQEQTDIFRKNPIFQVLTNSNPMASIIADSYRLSNSFKNPVLDLISGSSANIAMNNFNKIFNVYKNPVDDIFKNMPWLENTYNLSNKIEKFYNPANVLAGLPKYFEISLDLHNKFSNGFIDFTKNSILSYSIENLISNISESENSELISDEDVIIDNLNVALNIDYQNSGMVNFDLPLHVYNHLISQVNIIFEDGKEWTIEKINRIQNLFKSRTGKLTLGLLSFIVGSILQPKIERLYDKLTGHQETPLVAMNCVALHNKAIRLEPKWDSEITSTIPRGSKFIKVETNEDGKWIRVMSISEESIVEGWTDNADLAFDN